MEAHFENSTPRLSALEQVLGYGVTLFFLTLPFQWALQPASGIDLPVGRVLVLGIVLGWLFVRLAQRRLEAPRHITSIALISFLVIAVASIGWSEEPAWAFRKAVFLLTYIPLFFVVADLARARLVRGWILRAIVWGAGLAAGVGILQFASQFVFGVGETFHFWLEFVLQPFLGAEFGRAVAAYPSLLVNIGGETMLRTSAFFPDPHMMAYYMGLSLPFALYLSVSEPSWRQRRCFGALGTLIFLADILTFSRGGYIALAMAGVVSGGWWLWERSSRKKGFFIVTAIFVGVSLFSLGPIGERFESAFSLTEGSNRERLRLWTEAVEHISPHPFMGYGLGNYPLVVKPSAGYREPIYAHNLYLDIAVETGLLGLFFWLLFFCGIVVSAGAQWGRKHRRLSLALWGAAVVYATHSFFETPLFSVHILPLFLSIAALVLAGEESD